MIRARILPPVTNAPSYFASPALSRVHAWALALTATLTMAVSYVDRQALAALAPAVSKVFDLSDTQYGWLVSAFSVAYLVGAPFAGWLIDHLGARRGLLGAVVAWSFVAAAHALAPSFTGLLVLRVALGLTESPSFPGAAQTIQRVLPAADRARGFGFLFTGSSLGAIVAPQLAPFLEKNWGLRIAFLGTALVGLAWVPLWILLAWRSPAREVLDAEHAPSANRPHARSVMTHPAVLRAALAIMASAPATGFLLNWSSKYLAAGHGIPQAKVGPYLIIPLVLYDAGAILFGHFASVRGRARVGGAPDRPLFAIGIALHVMLALTAFGRTPVESMVLGGLGLAGGGGVFAMLTADMLTRVPPSIASAASGVCAAAQSIALIVASPALGRLIDITGGYTIPFLAVGAWVLPGCVAWLLWSPPPPHEERSNA
ncbi:MFS transporter [Polyangium sp. y55x31]|uniref:MFS transporter n=1 Tax=Polyangium sp. y55x31 TaxID=3042688 RepID=UPI002482CD18|nr:MFS transporter [Polyangium sp. y55x31]MDI1477845.1 MFS transporter [Polyangium sp. y55x31]